MRTDPGLIEEGEEIIGNLDESPLRDAGLSAAAHRVEHNEIAAWIRSDLRANPGGHLGRSLLG